MLLKHQISMLQTFLKDHAPENSTGPSQEYITFYSILNFNFTIFLFALYFLIKRW